MCLSTVEGGMLMPCKLSFQNGWPELQCVAWNQPACTTCRMLEWAIQWQFCIYIRNFQLLTPTCVFFVIYGKKFRKRKSQHSFLSPHFSAGVGKIFPKALPGGKEWVIFLCLVGDYKNLGKGLARWGMSKYVHNQVFEHNKCELISNAGGIKRFEKI